MGMQRTRFELEALEPRVYLSAEPGSVALAAAASHGASHWYAERATGLAHHSTLSEDLSYQDDSEGLFAGLSSSTSAATTHTHHHSHEHKQPPAASVSVAAKPVVQPAVSAASSSSTPKALASGASSAASISSILPDLATALSSNIFPTDATVNGVLELNGITYSISGSTVTVSATDATLFPGNSFQAVFRGTSANPALTGTFNIATQKYTFTATNMALSVGDALTISASKVTFSNSTGSFAAAVSGASAQLNLFAGSGNTPLSLSNFNASSFSLTSTGFSLGGFSQTFSGVQIGTSSGGNFLTASSITLDVGNSTGGSGSVFSVTYPTTPTGTTTVSGTMGLSSITGLTLLGNSVSGSITSANYDFSTVNGTGGVNPGGALKLAISNFALEVGGQVMIGGSAVITPGATQVMVSGTVGTGAGQSDSLSLAYVPADPTDLNVSLTTTAGTQAISDYTVSGGSVTVASLSSYLGNGFTSGTLTVIYNPSLVSIASASVTVAPIGVSVNVNNFALTSTGFTLADGTISATSPFVWRSAFPDQPVFDV